MLVTINGRTRRKIINLYLRFFSIKKGVGYISRKSVLPTRVTIGEGTRINGPMHARGNGELVIGNYCAIGHQLKVITSNHNIGLVCLHSALNKKLGVTNLDTKVDGIKIGNNVWIGDCCIILPNVTIGDGAILGAGSVVTKDVAPFTIVAGNPAREIRKRFSEEKIKKIQEAEWWYWSLEKMQKNSDFFNNGENI